MSKRLRDIETKKGLLPRGGSLAAREGLQKRAQENNRAVLAGQPGAAEHGRKIGRAQNFLSKRMVKRGQHAFRIFGLAR